ncbi:fumarylacetoacetate hydrolase family protein [Aspergillus nomiae NRRL 13137]|uniref:Fumarylacetoacetate hydrolase family protein n=1 Tax=Aspergillus nomiae NRRL (strain ATCC 15546 / NRRL 13137 / CBS 260.88 / M93) TaxID=1509407 RepID=A0A0L1IVN6_ASPN3|nr:fumarylacetoacetate hydrolase family protein [Aspergillus nomiae NRRL 13137]KNG83552.1 fumarylacetoacetate hydrolase family protein [Aspergillus nomiae NRRL 13137]
MSKIASTFSRLVRFVPKSNPSKVLIGEPVDAQLDVGLALYQGKEVSVRPFTGASVLNPGQKTESTEIISRVLSPLSQNEVGSIRCIGLNYGSHAAEMKLSIPDVPTLFIKPPTALSDPWPAPTVLPKITQVDNTGDYESEMVIVIGRDAKDVSEADALDYVLGYTAANDVSSRTSQMNQSQWCFSKGFDTSCPIGPALVSAALFPDASKFQIRGLKNGKVLQDCPLTDLIFSVPKLVSFLSQGTTLPAGTIILTGTPPGVGAAKNPKEFLKEGDEFAVELLPHVGTLVTKIENQK